MADTIVRVDSPDPNYTPVTGDVAANLYCRVTATNAAGSASANSNSVGPVTAAGGGAFTFIGSTDVTALSDPDTPNLDCTGADLLLVIGNAYAAITSISDNGGNTWTALTLYDSGSLSKLRIWYSRPTTVRTDHSVSIVGTSIYCSACFAAFSGSVASPFGSENGNIAGTGSPATSGSITPSNNGQLIISAVGIDIAQSAPMSIDGGFTKICDRDRLSNLGLGVGWLAQPTAAAVNPSWTLPGAGTWVATIASFKSA